MASNLALSGMIVALINAAYPGIPVPVLMVLAALSGWCLAPSTALLVWLLGIPAIVVTLGTLTIYRGCIFLIAGGQWVNADQMTHGFRRSLPASTVLGLPLLVLVCHRRSPSASSC